MSLLLYPGIRPGKRIAFASAYCTTNMHRSAPSVAMCAWNKTFSDVMGFNQLNFSFSQPMKEKKYISANTVTVMLEERGVPYLLHDCQSHHFTHHGQIELIPG